MEKIRAEKLEQMLFTSSKPDEVAHRCVVAIDAKHAVSFRHGQHSMLEENETVVLYNVVDPTLQYEAIVSAVSDHQDIIIFKLTVGEFMSYPHATDTLYPGKPYLQLGVNPRRQALWKEGIVSERKVGFYVGTSHGSIGDSGSGIFDSFGQFLGLSIGKKSSAFKDRENMPIGEVADHHPDTQIINADVILCVSGLVDEEFDFYSNC